MPPSCRIPRARRCGVGASGGPTATSERGCCPQWAYGGLCWGLQEILLSPARPCGSQRAARAWKAKDTVARSLLVRPLIAAVAVLALASCTGGGTPTEDPSSPPPAPVRAMVTVPATAQVANGTDEASINEALVEELFTAAPVVVVASKAEVVRGASAAASLGVPLLLDGPASARLIEKLGARTALVVGDVADPGIDIVAPASDDELASLIGGSTKPVGDDIPAALSTLSPASPALLVPDQTMEASAVEADLDQLPPIAAPQAAGEVMILSTGASNEVAAIGSARAAGASIIREPSGDPRSSSATIKTLSAHPEASIIALGDTFGDAETLAWRAQTAATGVELPGGGQLVFPGKTYVALYGTPGAPVLGVLGEQGLEATITRAREQAARFTALTENTVIPTMEIITTVASAQPGPDQMYSTEIDIANLRPFIEAAGEAGNYVVLDLQPGRMDFLTQAKKYEELLKLPYVGLALDPEWRLKPNQRHLTQIGTVDIGEVNQVVTWLADLTRENHLPQKVLILHQFLTRMIPEANQVDQSRSEVAIVIHADGQGPQGAKHATWRMLRDNAPLVTHWGWKNFYDEDTPMLTPEQTMTQVDPVPDFISYQ